MNNRIIGTKSNNLLYKMAKNYIKPIKHNKRNSKIPMIMLISIVFIIDIVGVGLIANLLSFWDVLFIFSFSATLGLIVGLLKVWRER